MLSTLPHPPAASLILGGIFLLLVIAAQMLVGYRKIRFKGRTHLKVHKGVAWALAVAALVHGLLALVYLGVFD
jgi:hypothetical protein